VDRGECVRRAPDDYEYVHREGDHHGGNAGLYGGPPPPRPDWYGYAFDLECHLVRRTRKR
jgi:hypothetical protein